MNMIKRAALAAIVLGLTGSPAVASIIYTTSGTTSGGSVAGTAEFVIGASTMDITLTNTTASVGAIAQVLDGLSFTLTGGTGLTFTGVTASGFKDCTSGTCVSTGTFLQYPGNPNLPGTVLNSPYGWTYSAPNLFAGAGSFKPAGIVNSSLTSLDGIPNREHNDYLLGPVTFAFSFITAPTGVTGATFYWGTRPETTVGTSGGSTGGGGGSTGGNIPEPATLALLGLGLFAIALASRRRPGAIR